MEVVYGIVGVDALECINPQKDKWKVRWDIVPTGNGEEVTFRHYIFNHKPTISEVKEIILSWMNSEIDKKILEGFEWKGMSVWLSSENQFNYKAAYDLAVQTGGANLPVVFKFGTTEEPMYHEFKDVDELSDFYTKAMAYINSQLAEGWIKKDSVDWSTYALILDK